MALSERSKLAVKIAFCSIPESDEFVASVDTPATLSAKAIDVLAIAMASKALAEEIAVVVAAGSGTISAKAKAAFEIAVCSIKDSDEVVLEIEA